MKVIITLATLLAGVNGIDKQRMQKMLCFPGQFNLEILAPDEVAEEADPALRELVGLTGFAEEYLLGLGRKLLERVMFIPRSSYEAELPRAREWVLAPEHADYVATALATGAEGVWDDGPLLFQAGAPLHQVTTEAIAREARNAQRVLAVEAREGGVPGGEVGGFDPVRDRAMTPEYVTDYLTNRGLKCIFDEDLVPRPRYYLNLPEDQVTDIERPLPDLKALDNADPVQWLEIHRTQDDKEEDVTPHAEVIVFKLRKPYANREYWQLFMGPSKYHEEKYVSGEQFTDSDMIYVFSEPYVPPTPPPNPWPSAPRVLQREEGTEEPTPPEFDHEIHIAFTPEQMGFAGFDRTPPEMDIISSKEIPSRLYIRDKDIATRRQFLVVGKEKVFDIHELYLLLAYAEDGMDDGWVNKNIQLED